MIYFLSDLHGWYESKDFAEYLTQPHEKDLLIVLGDTQLGFPNNEEFTKRFLSTKNPIALVDGNHENHDFLFSCPTEKWNGGIVNRLSENVVYLRRGNIYTIEGKTFFVFGGCRSSAKWREMGLYFPRQEASEEEYEFAYKNLAKNGNKVDYVLSHKYSKDRTDQYLVEGLCALTEFIDEKVDFKKWYFGHTHIPANIDERHTCVFLDLVKIEE